MSIPDESSSEMIFEVNNDKQFGEIVGCCKWFNKKLGYGFSAWNVISKNVTKQYCK